MVRGACTALPRRPSSRGECRRVSLTSRVGGEADARSLGRRVEGEVVVLEDALRVRVLEPRAANTEDKRPHTEQRNTKEEGARGSPEEGRMRRELHALRCARGHDPLERHKCFPLFLGLARGFDLRTGQTWRPHLPCSGCERAAARQGEREGEADRDRQTDC